MHGMYATLNAELELQRTIKEAELTAFPFFLQQTIGPTTAQVHNQEITDG